MAICFFIIFAPLLGGLAQLARALAWHARGHRFDSDILHSDVMLIERPESIREGHPPEADSDILHSDVMLIERPESIREGHPPEADSDILHTS
jgi:hypothetical protein